MAKDNKIVPGRTEYFDNVVRPAHYLHGKKETIEVIRDCMTSDEFHGYLKGNILKYVLGVGCCVFGFSSAIYPPIKMVYRLH